MPYLSKLSKQKQNICKRYSDEISSKQILVRLCSIDLCLNTNLILNKTLSKYNNDQISNNDQQTCLQF